MALLLFKQRYDALKITQCLDGFLVFIQYHIEIALTLDRDLMRIQEVILRKPIRSPKVHEISHCGVRGHAYLALSRAFQGFSIISAIMPRFYSDSTRKLTYEG